MAAVDTYPEETARIPAKSAPESIELRKERFAQFLAAKVEQGYDVESQGDTEGVIVARGRRRRFRSRMVGRRQRISVDEQGRARGRGL